MFIKTITNEFINTNKVEHFEVKQMKNSEEYAILAMNEEFAYVIKTYKSYIVAFTELENIIKTINK